MVMGHSVPGSGAGDSEFTHTDIATTCTEEKVIELALRAPEQPIWEQATFLKRGFTKPKQIPAVLLWMIPTHEGLQTLFAAALSKSHRNKRAAISQGTASKVAFALCQGVWIPSAGFVEEKEVKSHVTNSVFNKDFFFFLLLS